MRIGPYIGTRSATPAGFRPQSAYMAPQNRDQQATKLDAINAALQSYGFGDLRNAAAMLAPGLGVDAETAYNKLLTGDPSIKQSLFKLAKQGAAENPDACERLRRQYGV